MSSYYYLYAEKKQKSQTDWQLVANNDLCEGFKFFISALSEGRSECNLWDRALYLDADKASLGLKKKYEEDYEGHPEEMFEGGLVRYITARDFRLYLNAIIDDYISTMNCTFMALDVPFRKDIDDCVELGKYDDDGNLDKNYQPLTLPVNKELFVHIADQRFAYETALRLLGTIDTAESIAGVYDFDSDKDPVEV